MNRNDYPIISDSIKRCRTNIDGLGAGLVTDRDRKMTLLGMWLVAYDLSLTFNMTNYKFDPKRFLIDCGFEEGKQP